MSKIIRKKRYYQLEAVDAAVKELTGSGRASIKMACGTGKTAVSMWIAQALSPRALVVVAPTIALVDQLYCEWVCNRPWADISAMAVCSKQVGGTIDEIDDVDLSRLSYPVSTSPAKIREFISTPSKDGNVKIILSTYDSLPAVAKGMPEDFSFDLGVFDEAHNMTGFESKKRAFGLSEDNIRIARRLFLTATPRMFDYAGDDVSPTQKPKKIFSMDDRSLFGKFAYSYNFAQAIKDGVIKDYLVVFSVIDKSTIGDIKNGKVKFHGRNVSFEHVAVASAIEKVMNEHGINKVFSFHSRLEDASELVNIGKQLCDEIEYGFISGSMSSKERKKIINKMKKVQRMVATNSKCLVEGINFPEIGMVVFASAVNGKIMIVQAVGRALRIPRGYNGEKAIVMIPIFVDNLSKMEDKDWGKYISKYSTAVNVLGALKDEGEDMASLFSNSAGRELLHRGRSFVDEKLGGNILINCVSGNSDINTSHIRDMITTHCVRKLFPEWDGQYIRLKLFKETYDAWPTSDFPGGDLYSWSNSVRASRRNGTLSLEKIAKLDSIGFPWNARDATFLNNCVGYVGFKETYGYIVGEPPKDHFYSDIFERREEGKYIKWRDALERQYMKGTLSDFQIVTLRNIGIVFGDTICDFVKIFDDAAEFVTTMRREPSERSRSAKEKRIALQLKDLALKNIEGKLPDNRVMLLKTLGVGRWRTLSELRARGSQAWFERMENSICPYFNKTGRTPRPDDGDKDVRAEGRWFLRQSELFNQGKLTMEQERFILEHNLIPIQPDDKTMLLEISSLVEIYPEAKGHFRNCIKRLVTLGNEGVLDKKTKPILDKLVEKKKKRRKKVKS